MGTTQILSWLGMLLGFSIGIPQIVKSIRTKSTQDISAVTFLLIFLTGLCFLVRAIAIREPAFVFYYLFILLSGGIQLFLIWKYRKKMRPVKQRSGSYNRNRLTENTMVE